MGFGADAIAVVTGGFLRSTGSFAERLVSWGFIGDISSGVVTLWDATFRLFWRRRGRR
jgi:hypothetical protein